MKTYKRFCLSGLFTAIFVLCCTLTAFAADLTTCGNCHDWTAKPNSDVTKFVLPVIPDGSPEGSTVDKSKCVICHKTDLAPIHMTGVYPQVQTVDGVVYGAFLSLDSVYKPPAYLHNIHNAVSTKLTGPTCLKCHAVAACSSCHTSVPHDNHYTANPVNPLTDAAIATPVLTSQATGYTNYVDGIVYPTWNISTTCATAECHQTLPAPKRFRPDGTELCYNCHTTASSGHSEEQIDTIHTSVFPEALTFNNQLTGTYVVDCSGCHNSDLDNEHADQGQDCMACHQSQNTGVLEVIASADGLETNRSCENCHFNSSVIAVPAEHDLFHIAAQSDNLHIDGGPHDDCNTCHQREELLSLVAGLATEVDKNYSCLTCHTGSPNPKDPIHVADYDGQQMEIVDLHQGCDTCHTPGTTYAAAVETIISKLNDPVNPAAGYSCTECHTDLVSVHMPEDSTSAMCLECHQADSADGTSLPAVHTKNSESTVTCVTCHSSDARPPVPEAVAANDTSCGACHFEGSHEHNVTVFEQEPDTDCIVCHSTGSANQAAELASLHADYGYRCSVCHNSTFDEVITLDKNLDMLKNSVTPIYCSTCHNGNSAAGFPETRESAHDPEHMAFGEDNVSCSGCHSFNAPFGSPTDVTVIHQSSECNTCHSSSNEAVLGFIRDRAGSDNSYYTCEDCHNSLSQHDELHVVTDYRESGAGTGCASCHSDDVTIAHESTAGKCNACHGLLPVPATITENLSTNPDRTGYTCEDCHTLSGGQRQHRK
ncbi:cytochrome c3 family protein [Phosphitispora sp. TUW77]|uniref:cytochrome c3 family protein n=1 Tax=Phosphitispora sp. TUW77 TaxID=3152361 RepID=UPI003AB2823B